MDTQAYGDGRRWDDGQRQRVNDILNRLRDNLDHDYLANIRSDTLYLMDVVFPTGFVYTVNRGPSEQVTGDYMKGDPDA